MSQEAVECSTCLYSDVEGEDPPCRDCRYYRKWRSKSLALATTQPEPEIGSPEQRRSLDDATPQEWNAAAQALAKERRVDVTKLAQDPLKAQVGGDHYKNRAIQPVVYSHANKLNGLEASIVKRITRWRDKPAETRFQDLEKIKHEVDLLIALEKQYG